MALGLIAAGFVVVSALSAWMRPSAAPSSVTRLQGFLPRGSVLHSLVRLELDGLPPQETAVVAAVPAFPGAAESVYYGFIFAYDRWRRRTTQVYAEPLAGPIPIAPDAGHIDRRHEAVIFRSLRDDGSHADSVVGFLRGRLQEVDAVRARQIIAALPPAPPGVTWQYRLRAGTIPAQALVVRVRVRQPVQVAFTGGGPTPIIVPDTRLDILEKGYRARTPGTYTIRIFLPFGPDQGYTLRLVVEPPS